MTFDELPQSWQEKVRELRRENARLRLQRNEARDALAELALKVAGGKR